MCVVFTETATTFTVPLADTTVTESDTVTLQCQVSKPNKEVKWLRNGKEVKPDERYQVTVDGTTHSLTLDRALVTDSATFTAKIDRDKTVAKLVVNGTLTPTIGLYVGQ